MGLFDRHKKSKKHGAPKKPKLYSDLGDDLVSWGDEPMPTCPLCRNSMLHSFLYDKFQCPHCGYTMDDDNFTDIYSVGYDEDMPECCAACGGPYPDCMDSCSIFDD